MSVLRPVDTDELKSLLAPKPLPILKTSLVKSVVISQRTNELPCGWKDCGEPTFFRVWGLARCFPHVLDDLEQEFTQERN